jgi:glutamate formiminotransferase
VCEISNELGSEVGEKLGIPVYLYEDAARSEERRNLENIRKENMKAWSKS